MLYSISNVMPETLQPYIFSSMSVESTFFLLFSNGQHMPLAFQGPGALSAVSQI